MKTAQIKPIKTEDLSPLSQCFGEWLGLFLTLVLAAVLRLWGLNQNGTGNAYYAAAVRSMLMNWHNFFFASFDPVGWVSVDKPPVSLWIQTLSARLLGFSGFSIIFPQAVEGTLSVALVYFLVRRRFDAWAALIAALAMAVGPICVAVDRYNNTDECLMFVIILAAWAMSLAAERASRGWLLGAMVLVGIGFNTKMMVAFIVLPTFYLLYWLGAAAPWKRRFADLTIASVILGMVALSWPLAVDFTPASQRPFVGSTQDNSMISLSLGWNGFQRLLSRRRGGPVTATATSAVTAKAAPTPSADSTQSAAPVTSANVDNSAPVSQNRRGNRRGGFGGMGTGQPGPLRLADPNMAGQIIWFLPIVLLGLWSAFKREDFRWPLNSTHSALFLWSLWFLTYGLVFSFMKGAMHTYYIIMLAPPLAALTGIGTRALWLSFKAEEKNWVLLPLAFLLTVAWQIYIWTGTPHWAKVIWPVLLLGVGLSVAGLAALRGAVQNGEFSPRWLPISFVVGLVILFISPTVWSLTAVLAPDRSVEANPNLLSGNGGQGFGGRGGFGEDANNEKLLSFLEAHEQNPKYLVVAQNSQAVSSIIINTGKPAISIGGFMGGDPTITLDQFIEKVKTGEFRYILIGGMGRGGFGGPGNAGGPNGQPNPGSPAAGGAQGSPRGGDQTGPRAEIAKWVREHGKKIDPALWRLERPRPEISNSNRADRANNGGANNGFGGGRGAGMELYELGS